MSQKNNYNSSKNESGIISIPTPAEVVDKATGVSGKKNYQSKSIKESSMMESIYYTKGNNSSDTPFYYDQQLRDKRLTVTLHPNAKYAGSTWVPFPKEECFDRNVLKETEYLYRIKPLATAIASEDFMVNVSNSWTDFGKTNPLEEMYNSIKPYAGIVASLADSGIEEAIGGYDYANSDSSVVRGIGKVVDLAKKASNAAGLTGGLNQLGDILNRQLTVQGTRFAYFNGSTSTFGNLSMKFTVFSDWILDGGSYKFITCYEQLEELYDYAMSKYEEVSGDVGLAKLGSEITGDLVGKALKDEKAGKGVSQKTKEFIERHFKWQLPPGGFRADLKSIDNVQRGTLKLRINDMYTLENLVITSMNASYSRIPCKHPTEPGKIIPLYADIVLSLQPATMYTDTALKAFVEGKAWDAVRGEENMRKDDATGKYNSILYEIEKQ